jgi:hypothetical protein
MALTAPSLCPRCDAPAIMTDHCIQCALPLRQCGSCQGIAGPFDRYCGFCGYELVQGTRRAPLWRLWLLAALIPLAAGIAFGFSPWARPVTRTVATIVGASEPTPNPATTTQLHSESLLFSFAAPKTWIVNDYSHGADPTKQMPYVVVAHYGPDAVKVSDAKADLLQVKGQSAVVELGRANVNPPAVDPADPRAVLAAEVAPLVTTPPAGLKFEVVTPVRSLIINGRPAAAVLLRLTRDSGTYYLERAYISSPTVGQPPLLKFDALVPTGDWDGAGDNQRVDDMLRSVKFP